MRYVNIFFNTLFVLIISSAFHLTGAILTCFYALIDWPDAKDIFRGGWKGYIDDFKNIAR